MLWSGFVLLVASTSAFSTPRLPSIATRAVPRLALRLTESSAPAAEDDSELISFSTLSNDYQTVRPPLPQKRACRRGRTLACALNRLLGWPECLSRVCACVSQRAPTLPGGPACARATQQSAHPLRAANVRRMSQSVPRSREIQRLLHRTSRSPPLVACRYDGVQGMVDACARASGGRAPRGGLPAALIPCLGATQTTHAGTWSLRATTEA